jgi:peptide/nickel transport system permease protein
LITNKKLWVSALSLVVVHLVVAGAAFFAPYDPAEQHRDVPFAPPARLHFAGAQGKPQLRPYVCSWSNQIAGVGPARYVEDCSRAGSLRFFVRSQSASGTRWHLFGTDGPAHAFLLGTDDYGRDQLSRLLFGGQVSLFSGLLATALSLGLGLLLGGIAGYFGSWLDDTIMRGAEVFMALPWIYLLFAVRAFLPLHIGARQSFFLLIGVMGLTSWARPSRLVRGVILSAKERDFVRAARGFGASSVYIFRRHLLPETSGVMLTQAALLIPQCILAEVTLSFLGLGVGEPVSSWGNMLASLQKYYVLVSYWWMFIPGIALIPVFMLYNALANALASRFRIAEPDSEARVQRGGSGDAQPRGPQRPPLAGRGPKVPSPVSFQEAL